MAEEAAQRGPSMEPGWRTEKEMPTRTPEHRLGEDLLADHHGSLAALAMATQQRFGPTVCWARWLLSEE